MKIQNNKNINLLLFAFSSAVLITYITPHTMLFIVTAFIGFILISSLFFSDAADDSFQNNHGSFGSSDKDISFFNDFNSDD